MWLRNIILHPLSILVFAAVCCRAWPRPSWPSKAPSWSVRQGLPMILQKRHYSTLTHAYWTPGAQTYYCRSYLANQ